MGQMGGGFSDWFWLIFTYVQIQMEKIMDLSLVYGLLYALIGLLFGELYLRGCQKVGHQPDKLSYVIGITLWPATLVLWVVGAGIRRK